MRTSLFLVATSAVFLGGASCGSNTEPPSACTTDCAGSPSGSGGTGGASGTGGSIQEPVECPDPPATTPARQIPLDSTTPGEGTIEFRINHLGYSTEGSKRAVLETDQPLSQFQLVREGDSHASYEGQLEEVSGFSAWRTDRRYFVADFSDLREPGEYTLRVQGRSSSSFRLGPSLAFAETVADIVGYFRGSRADDTDVWNADANVSKYGGGGSADVRGGWYDASGDISKYLSHLSYANFLNPQQIPLVAWALAWSADHAGTRLGSLGLLDGVQAEALWGADYLTRVLDEAGYFYITVFDTWTGDLGARDICAFEGEAGNKTGAYQAAFREGGGAAIAALARISAWGRGGELSSEAYLAAAEKGFAHLLANGPSYADDRRENVIDDYTALLAASELFARTQKAEYLTHARARAGALAARLTPAGYFIADAGSRPFWHASDAGLPVVALVRYLELETDAAAREAAVTTIEKHLDYLLDVTSEVANPYGYARQQVAAGRSSFFVPHTNETGYWWQGESARLASLATAALLGGRAVAEARGCPAATSEELRRYADDQLDWILGKNPFDVSFLAGTGRNNPPSYCAEKAPYHGHLNGGISNGITGRNADGSGIQWTSGNPTECWHDWRWVEQWLPHSTWYLLAITAASEG